MKQLTASLLLATANVAATGLAFLFLRTTTADFVGLVLAMAVVPVALVITIVLALRDMFKPSARRQALLALALSLVPLLFRNSLEI